MMGYGIHAYSFAALWSLLTIGIMIGLFILIILAIIFMVKQISSKK